MPNEISVIQSQTELAPKTADSDEAVLGLFLHGRCVNTRTAYEHDIRHFMGIVSQPLRIVGLGDLQSYADRLENDGLAASSRYRKLSAVKSLLGFAHRIGYLAFDVGRPLRLPKFQDRLSERILSEADVQRMIALEQSQRNRSILISLYGIGCRASELCHLSVRDCHARDDGGANISLFAKGGKTNVVFAPSSIWSVISPLVVGLPPEAPIFRNRYGRRLRRETITRIVRAAARRSRIEKPVSAHWMRHAHASHAIDRGSPLSLVTAQLSHSSTAISSKYLHARIGDSSARYLAI